MSDTDNLKLKQTDLKNISQNLITLLLLTLTSLSSKVIFAENRDFKNKNIKFLYQR